MHISWLSPGITDSPFKSYNQRIRPHTVGRSDTFLSNGNWIGSADFFSQYFSVHPPNSYGNGAKCPAATILVRRGGSSLCDNQMTQTIGDREIAICSRSLNNLDESESTSLPLHHSSNLGHIPSEVLLHVGYPTFLYCSCLIRSIRIWYTTSSCNSSGRLRVET